MSHSMMCDTGRVVVVRLSAKKKLFCHKYKTALELIQLNIQWAPRLFPRNKAD